MDEVKVYFTELNENWDKQISKFSFDIYHLSGWSNSSIVIDAGEPKGLIAEYKRKYIFLPFIIRKISQYFWDATCAYGYGGPVIDSHLSFKDINTMLEAIQSFLYKEGCVSFFTRLNPVIHQQLHSKIGTLVTHGITLMSDLSKTEDEHWCETQNQHRRGIKKALTMNIITQVEMLNSDTIPSFLNIYYETMKKNQASDYYFFNEDYFQNLAKNMVDRLLMITAYDEDQAIASSIYTLCPESGIIQFHLGGTLDHYRSLQPSKLITHQARDWGRKNGYKVLHLGGGVGGQLDTLYSYKRGFSSKELEFKTWQIIINSDKYSELVAKNSNLLMEKSPPNYFPLYRYKAENLENLNS